METSLRSCQVQKAESTTLRQIVWGAERDTLAFLVLELLVDVPDCLICFQNVPGTGISGY